MKLIKLLALFSASAFLYACGSDNSGGGGNSTFKSVGGAGFGNTTTASSGGNGGRLDIEAYGDVKVRKSGGVDTGFTVPSYDAGYGNRKLTVSSSRTLVFVNFTSAQPPSGVAYVLEGDSVIYESDGNSGIPYSGLEVMEGATLQVPTNSQGRVDVRFPYAVTINGTIRPFVDATGLDITAGDYDSGAYSLIRIGPKGVVTTKSTSPGTPGGDINLYSNSVIINQGTIDASGSDGTTMDGGFAGSVDFEADTFIYNTGKILAKGGTSTDAGGGSGGRIELYAYFASIFSSGTFDASGAEGATTGGSAGGIKMFAGDDGNEMGGIVVSGSLLNNGGNAGTGDAGSATSIKLASFGGKVASSATVSATGGSSKYGRGGNGDAFKLEGDYGEDFEKELDVDTKGIKLTGDIDLSGGSGATGGGEGGKLKPVIISYSDFAPLPNPSIELVGYSGFNLDGGDGFASGGSGGVYRIETQDYQIYDSSFTPPFGAILSEVPVSAKGGSAKLTRGSNYQGGEGGRIRFNTDFDSGSLDLATLSTINSGAINIAGGTGDIGGSAGKVYMYGYGKVTNSGDINATGGDGTTRGGSNNYSIGLYSAGDISNSGAINLSAGHGDFYGGYADEAGVEIYAGGHLKNSAAISVNGGNGKISGGDGGSIDLLSESDPTDNSGNLSVFKGTGGSEAEEGWIWIDWVDVGPAHAATPGD